MGEPENGPSIIPIIEEAAFVTKRAVETEHVRVRTSVETRATTLSETVSRDHVTIERVPVDRRIDQAPEIREEEGVTIIPVIEERAVVVRQLFLVEEIRITRSTRAEPVEIPVTLRRTRVDVMRDDLTETQQEDVHGGR